MGGCRGSRRDRAPRHGGEQAAARDAEPASEDAVAGDRAARDAQRGRQVLRVLDAAAPDAAALRDPTAPAGFDRVAVHVGPAQGERADVEDAPATRRGLALAGRVDLVVGDLAAADRDRVAAPRPQRSGGGDRGSVAAGRGDDVTRLAATTVSVRLTGPLPCTPPLNAIASPTVFVARSSLPSIRERSIVAVAWPSTNTPPPMLPVSTLFGQRESIVALLPEIALRRIVSAPLSTTCESTSVSGPFAKTPPPSESLDSGPKLRLRATSVRVSVSVPLLKMPAP
jgi:hypothetical protein